jgi:hypothetical protein
MNFSVSSQTDKQEIAQLQRANAELTQSLERCRELVAECRSKLAANSNLREGEEPVLRRNRW